MKLDKPTIDDFTNSNHDHSTSQQGGLLTTYVPYTGATGDVNLGAYGLITPSIVGGSATSSILTFKATSGNGMTAIVSMNFLVGNNGGTTGISIKNDGKVGIGLSVSTAYLQVRAGSSTVGPLKLNAGTNLDNAQAGVFEYDGTDLFFTPVATRKTIAFTDHTHTGYIPYTGGNSNVDLGVYNLTVDSTTFFVDSTNHRVGVGTITPQTGFEIKDNIIVFTDTDVANGISASFHGNSYGYIGINNSTAGGLSITGISDADSLGVYVWGVIGSETPTSTTPAILFRGNKKSGTTFQALAATDTLFELRNNTTATLTVLGNGYVGFGTVTPVNKFEIIHNGSGRWATTITNNNANGAGLLVVSSNSAQPAFDVTNGTSNLFRILGTGKVGIGTASPTYQLEIKSGTAGFAFDAVNQNWGTLFGTGGNFSIFAELPGSTTGGVLFMGGSTRADLNKNAIVFKANNTEYMRIDGNFTGHTIGNVGIGTNAPVSKLHVEGTTSTGELVVNTTNSGGSISIASLFSPNARGDSYFTVGRSLSAANATLIGLSSTGTATKYAFMTTYGRPASDFVVSSSGNVGVGTITPEHKFSVNGAVGIGATQGFIKLWNGTTTAPEVDFFIDGGTTRKMVFGYDGSVSRGIFYSDGLVGGMYFFDASGIAIGGNPTTYASNLIQIPKAWTSVLINGKMMLGSASTPTAYLHLAAGTTTAGTAPIKLTAGVNNTAIESGTMEYDGTNLYFSPSTTRKTIAFTSDIPSASTFVPYTGATTQVMLDEQSLVAKWLGIEFDGANWATWECNTVTTTDTIKLSWDFKDKTITLIEAVSPATGATQIKFGDTLNLTSLPMTFAFYERGLEVLTFTKDYLQYKGTTLGVFYIDSDGTEVTTRIYNEGTLLLGYKLRLTASIQDLGDFDILAYSSDGSSVRLGDTMGDVATTTEIYAYGTRFINCNTSGVELIQPALIWYKDPGQSSEIRITKHEAVGENQMNIEWYPDVDDAVFIMNATRAAGASNTVEIRMGDIAGCRDVNWIYLANAERIFRITPTNHIVNTQLSVRPSDSVSEISLDFYCESVPTVKSGNIVWEFETNGDPYMVSQVFFNVATRSFTHTFGDIIGCSTNTTFSFRDDSVDRLTMTAALCKFDTVVLETTGKVKATELLIQYSTAKLYTSFASYPLISMEDSSVQDNTYGINLNLIANANVYTASLYASHVDIDQFNLISSTYNNTSVWANVLVGDPSGNQQSTTELYANGVKFMLLDTTQTYPIEVYKALTTNSVLRSTLATGTAPFVIASTTLNTNLNADLLDSKHSSDFELALGSPETDGMILSSTNAGFRSWIDPPKVLYMDNQTNAISNATTTETNAHQFTLAANSLSRDGDMIEVVYSGLLAANTNNKTVKFYFGSNSYVPFTFYVSSTTTYSIKINLIRLGATTFRIIAVGSSSGNSSSQVAESSGTIDFTTTNVMKSTLTGVANADLTAKYFTVVKYKA